MTLAKITKGLGTYSGRDACIRVVAYFSLFLYGYTTKILNSDEEEKNKSYFLKFLLYFYTFESLPHLAKSCQLISKAFGTTRLIMRFFDDIPAINNLISYLKRESQQKVC